MSVNFSCIWQPLYGQSQWLALFLKGQHFIRQLCPLFYLQKHPHPKAAAACGWGFSIVAGTFPCPCVSIGFQPFFFYPFSVFLLPVKHEYVLGFGWVEDHRGESGGGADVYDGPTELSGNKVGVM